MESIIHRRVKFHVSAYIHARGCKRVCVHACTRVVVHVCMCTYTYDCVCTHAGINVSVRRTHMSLATRALTMHKQLMCRTCVGYVCEYWIMQMWRCWLVCIRAFNVCIREQLFFWHRLGSGRVPVINTSHNTRIYGCIHIPSGQRQCLPRSALRCRNFRYMPLCGAIAVACATLHSTPSYRRPAAGPNVVARR